MNVSLSLHPSRSSVDKDVLTPANAIGNWRLSAGRCSVGFVCLNTGIIQMANECSAGEFSLYASVSLMSCTNSSAA